MSKRLFLIFGIVLSLFAFALLKPERTAFAAGPYFVIALPPDLYLPSSATAINNQRQVLLNDTDDTNDRAQDQKAYIWQDGTLTRLPSFPDGVSVFGSGINDAGIVAGSAITEHEHNHAFRFENGALTDLGIKDFSPEEGPGGYNETFGLGINNSGRVVGVFLGYVYHCDCTEQIAGDAPGGQLTELGTLTTCDLYCESFALDINDAGVSVGSSVLTSDIHGCCYQAVKWEGVNPTPLDADTTVNSFAYAINNSGQAVGVREIELYGNQLPMLWENGSAINLLENHPEYESGTARGINNSGQIVGNAYAVATGNAVAALYENGTITDLNTLIPENTGWQLTHAFAINDNGDIVGTGIYDGDTSHERPFLLTQPDYIVNTTADDSDANIGDGDCETSAGDCSLRAAIQESNFTFKLDTVGFNIPGSGIPTIQPTTELPVINRPIYLDASTQPTAHTVELDGSNIVGGDFGFGGDGFVFTNDGNTLKGFVMNRVNGFSIYLNSSDYNTIQGNLINTDVTGMMLAAQTDGGIFGKDSSHNRIGGTTETTRNVIAQGGIYLRNGDSTTATDNLIEGNYVGLNKNGTAIAGGRNGIYVEGNEHTVAGNAVPYGIAVTGDSNTVTGNRIGTDATGAATVDVYSSGLVVEGDNNTIGGAPENGNVVVSEYDYGIRLKTSDNNTVSYNTVGTNSDGTLLTGTGYAGIYLTAGTGNTIRNNVIVKSGTNPDDIENDATYRAGIALGSADATGNTIQANWIGTNPYGTADLGGTDDGITLDDADNNLIVDNVIAGNGSDGIALTYGADGNTVKHNGIGTDLNENFTLGNGGRGIYVYISSDNIIGAPFEGNTIVNSRDAGIIVLRNDSTGNKIQGNIIRNTQSTPGNPNSGNAIHLVGGLDNEIGGIQYGEGNTITNNQGAGVAIEETTFISDHPARNPILSNVIYDNSGAGIVYLGDNAAGLDYAVPVISAWTSTPDNGGGDGGGFFSISAEGNSPDARDAQSKHETKKAKKGDRKNQHQTKNKKQNKTKSKNPGGASAEYVSTENGTTEIFGTLDGLPNTTYRIEYFANNACDLSGAGEGETLVGDDNVTTNGAGHVDIHTNLSSSLPDDIFLTATATDPNHNTSLFALCKTPVKLQVNDAGDAPDVTTADGTCLTAGGVCTLRAAITQANAQPNPDTITFNIPGGGIPTIQPLTELPTITAPVTLDATSQPDTNWVELDGSQAPHGLNDSVDGLEISAGSSTVRGFIINRFSGKGIHLNTNGGNTIVGNRIGTTADGLASAPNPASIWSEDAPNNIIGGTSSDDRNVIVGNVWLRGTNGGGNTVQGNYLGLDSTGLVALGSADIILIQDGDNTIGGTQSGARNVILGKISVGSDNNTIQGNYIGTDRTGMTAVGDYGGNIDLTDASYNLVGGDATRARNVIVNGGWGIYAQAHNHQTVGHNQIVNNYIGVAADGVTVIGISQSGIHFDHLDGGDGIFTENIIRKNVIAGAGAYEGEDGFGSAHGDGIRITGPATFNTIQDNYIGTDKNGATALGNRETGIYFDHASDNTIQNNVISANGTGQTSFGYAGISLNSESDHNTISSNRIGVSGDGFSPLANSGDGIEVISSSSNLIGGTSADLANVIAANGRTGVHLVDVPTTGNIVQGNWIGTNQYGSALGNGVYGVHTEKIFYGFGPESNFIGGTDAGQGNTIAFNTLDGIVLASPFNQARGNSIFSNGELGLDVSDNGVDTDVPVLTTAYLDNGTLEISGVSSPGQFGLDVYANSGCDASGFGEGETQLVATDIEGDENGAFDAAFSANVPEGTPLTILITSDSTGEFSECLTLSAPSYVSTTPNCNGNNPCYGTLTEAIAQAPRGSVVVVQGGTYNENVSVNRQLGLYFTGDVTINGAFDMGHGFVKGTNGSLTVTGDVNAEFVHYVNNGGTFVFSGSGAPSGGSPARAERASATDNDGTQSYTGNVKFNNVIVGENTILDTGSGSFKVQGTFTNNGALLNTPNAQTVNTATMVTFTDGAGLSAVGLGSNGAQGLGSATVSITRGMTPQACGAQNFPTLAIKRRVSITPANQNNISATLRLYYDDTEANGLALANVAIYHCDGAQWQRLTGNYTRGTQNGLNYVEVSGVTAFSPFGLGQTAAPTAASVTAFSGTALSDNHVQVTWTTGTEVDVLGFNLYRRDAGEGDFVKRNAELIPAQQPGMLNGSTYTYDDSLVTANTVYTYRLELVRVNGETEEVGKIKVNTNFACSVPLTPPVLGSPADKEKIKATRLTLTWSGESCATSYTVVVRRDNKKGAKLEQQKGITATEYKLTRLEEGTKYIWRVQACNAQGCGKWSKWAQFQIRGK